MRSTIEISDEQLRLSEVDQRLLQQLAVVAANNGIRRLGDSASLRHKEHLTKHFDVSRFTRLKSRSVICAAEFDPADPAGGAGSEVRQKSVDSGFRHRGASAVLFRDNDNVTVRMYSDYPISPEAVAPTIECNRFSVQNFCNQ
jgi:hypothetical protein